MSKGTTRIKPNMKKDSLSHNDRLSDDDDDNNNNNNNRRRSRYQMIEQEKQRRNSNMNDLRKTQLGILQNILLNQRNTNKIVSKHSTTRNGTTIPKARPISAKNPTISHWDQSNEATDHRLAKSIGEDRTSRSTKKDEQSNRIIRSQSRPHASISRSLTNGTLISDKTNIDPSSDQFKKLLIHLSSELNYLETITGFKPMKNDLFSCSSSTTALATALIGLVGHVKQCGSNAQEIHTLKEQLFTVVQTQIDFQQRIENQLATLQTMMQTICQVVNNDMLSNRRPSRDQTDLNTFQSNQNWLTNSQRPYLIEKDTDNAMNELLTFTRQMNNASPINTNQNSDYLETLEVSKKLIQPISTISIDENDTKSVRRSSMMSPLDLPSASPTETILEKILQERLRLIQQMNELNKQHEMTQEELANLEGKTLQS